jgi:hypothetical protein
MANETLTRAAVRWQRIMISKLELETLETLRRDLGSHNQQRTGSCSRTNRIENGLT